MSSLKRKSAIALVWDFGGLLISRGSGFVISIFLARLLSPSEFGLVGMASVFISISQVFIGIGFSSALIQRSDTKDIVYNSVFYFNIFTGICLTILFFCVAPYIASFYENELITPLVRWLSLSFLFNSFNQVQTAILTKKLDFKLLTIRNVVASLVGGGVGVSAALSGMGVYALVIQSLVAGLASTIMLWSISSWKPSLKFSFLELRGLMGFSLYVFFDRFVSSVFHKLDVLIIGKFFNPATLGYYSRAVSLKDQVSLYSSASIGKIFFPVLSSLQENKAEYEKVYFKVISTVSIVSFFLTGILFIMGEEVILFLFGAKWQASVPIFEVLILGVCTYPLNAMMINAFISRGKSKENFRIGLIRKAVQLIPLGIAYFFGIYEFTISVVAASYLLTFMNILYLNKYLTLSIKKHLVKLTEGLIPLLAFVLFYKIYGIKSFDEKAILCLLFVLIYYLFNRFLETEGYLFISSNLNSLIKRYKN